MAIVAGSALAAVLIWVGRVLAVSIAVRILAAFGLLFVSHKYVIQPVVDLIKGTLAGLPAEAVTWLSFFGIDRAISIVLSAYVARAALQAVHLARSPS